MKLTQGKLERALRRLSKALEGHLDRARIVISCRPSDWRPLLDADAVKETLRPPEKNSRIPSEPSEQMFVEAVRREYGLTTPAPHEQQADLEGNVVRTLMMLPMTNKQIERFAQQRRMQDVGAFLAAVRLHDAWTFARRPLDLAALVETWKQSGSLGTRLEQHETNVTTKLLSVLLWPLPSRGPVRFDRPSRRWMPTVVRVFSTPNRFWPIGPTRSGRLCFGARSSILPPTDAFAFTIVQLRSTLRPGACALCAREA